MSAYWFIALGGACGACLRHLLGALSLQWFGNGFPFGTLLVNVTGSLAIGFIYGLIEQGQWLTLPLRSFLVVGFIGAFTTFSTFSLDSLLLMQQGQWIKAGLNVLLNLLVCLSMAALGLYLTKH